jgi:Xaa-Pro dipeptidase
MYFNREEYVARWDRVALAMRARNYDTVLVWTRSAGTYDRIGNVLWLTNFTINGTGQDPVYPGSELAGEPWTFGAPWTFAAVLIRRGRDPELHVGLPRSFLDPSQYVCGELVIHEPNLMVGLAEYFRAQRIEGRVIVVGDDVLPGMYDRILRTHTPQIEWVSDETFLLEPQLIKSPRELEAFRTAGDIATRALTGLVEALIAGETGAEAAARAAAAIVRSGGGYHRIDVTHGPASDRLLLSGDLYGYNLSAPQSGDIVRAWIYGPLFEGYWLDPGRTAVCGDRPGSAQKALIEATANVVDVVVGAVAPGKTPRELGILGGALARRKGLYDQEQLDFPLLGHGVGTSFIPYIIPLGEAQPDPTGVQKYDEPLRAGMVLGVEAFMTQKGVGTAGFEQNVIVTDTGSELLTRTPMIFW